MSKRVGKVRTFQESDAGVAEIIAAFIKHVLTEHGGSLFVAFEEEEASGAIYGSDVYCSRDSVDGVSGWRFQVTRCDTSGTVPMGPHTLGMADD